MPRPRKCDADRLVPVSFRIQAASIARLEEIGAERSTDRSEAFRVLLTLGDAAYRRGDRPSTRAGDPRC